MSKEIVIEVLGVRDAKELWSVGYRRVLPVTPQEFASGAVLSTVLYLMRWGYRRGAGQFQKAFRGGIGTQSASINDVSNVLAGCPKWFQGFNSETPKAILGDLLLAFCLENSGRKLGRDEQVQRVFPTHYFSSWIDLPGDSANLRGVPELITAILTGENGGSRGFYPLRSDFDSNQLLKQFGPGMSIAGQRDNVKSDTFSEEAKIGLDQLLTVRLAQRTGEAPLKVRGGNSDIPRQLPLAQRATELFREDFNIFQRAYGFIVPRQSLLPMLESSLALGLTTILLSTVRLLHDWALDGSVTPKHEQEAWPLLVDCSSGTDTELRRYSEESMEDLVHRMGQLPVHFICLRILEQAVRGEDPGSIPESEPDPTLLVSYLGDVLYSRNELSTDIEKNLRRTCNKLAAALEDSGERVVTQILKDRERHPAWRLAEAIVVLMGDRLQVQHLRKFLDSCLMVNEPNGLARKRRIRLRGKVIDRRSIVLTDSVLDFLVHRHRHQAKKGVKERDLSLAQFIDVLRNNYGLHIDEAPPGHSIPSEDLRRNRTTLERRLRDLGLFVGVNDAEAMKRLRSRFSPVTPAPNGDKEKGG